MNRLHRCALVASLGLSSGCGAAPRASAARPVDACPAVLEGGDAFAAEHVEGTLVLRDEETGCTRATDPSLADVGFRPMSTFKLPNAWIGLETGVISGEAHTFRWDGRERRPDWNADMNLTRALVVSCVPCFQEVARGVGGERMATWLDRLDYGNRDIGGPIDQFWLTGPLRITPRQQVDLVHRSLSGRLPVSPAHIELVWRAVEIERTGDAFFRGKTGLGTQDGHAIGWLVGYVERAGRRHAYATVMRGANAEEREVERLIPLRKAITRRVLERAGLL